MFFLAGIGVLRVLWIPLTDLMPGTTWSEKVFNVHYILELGSIVYLPYDISVFIVGIAVLPIFLLINPLFPFGEFWEVFFLLSFFCNNIDRCSYILYRNYKLVLRKIH
jgi:hypothetical protein